jgi:RND family efflux transporter MFP subunit
MSAALRSRWVWLGIVSVALLAVAVVGLKINGAGNAGNTAPTSPIALTVQVVNPARVEWPELVRASGGITAWQEAIVGAEVNGLRLVELDVDVGDSVAKGQLLARFDDASTRAQLAQQQAAVAEARANVTEAQANAARAQRMRQNGALSEQNIVQYLTRASTAQAQLESAEARLTSQQLALDYTRVLAPDDGVISARQATLGMVAGPGTELFRLVRQHRLDWRAELTAAQLARVQIGDAATVQLADGSSVSGHVRQLAPVLDAASRTGIAYVELDHDSDSHARAGMYGSGTIALGESPALVVPSGAVALRDGYEYLFVLGPENRVEQVKVAVGRRIGDAVEITSGVSPQQQVVASGAAFLNDADTVRVVAATEAAR